MPALHRKRQAKSNTLPYNPLMSAAIERAHTLASSYYVDPAVLERERERVFFKTWQCVGYREQVQNPGDYFTFDLAGEPLLIVRDAAALRGFYNVCRHRAGPVAEA